MLERFEDLTRPENLQWPHQHSFYDIIWFKEGTVNQTIDYHEISIDSDTLFFISPGQVHLLSQSEKVKDYSLTFTEVFLLMNNFNKDAIMELTFLDDSYSNPYLRLTPEAINELESVIEMIMAETAKPIKSLSSSITSFLFF